MKCSLKFFKKLENFYEKNRTLAAYSENEIMDLCRYFCSRDMLLEANMVLGNTTNTENTEIAEDDDMETESILHDTSIDTLSKVEKFYLKHVVERKFMLCLSKIKTDGVDITKIDHMLILKSKAFINWKKKRAQY